jgi:hypothetical protein
MACSAHEGRTCRPKFGRNDRIKVKNLHIKRLIANKQKGKPMNSAIKVCAVASLSIGLNACGTLYKLDVTAYNNPNHDLDNTYVILSSNRRIDLRSPEFELYAEQLERALSAKQYRRIRGEDPSEADLAVYMYVEISDPAKRYHQVNNAVMETGYDTTTTRESQTVGNNQGGGSQGQGGSQTRSVEPPRPDMLIGYETQQFATTVYAKHLRIRAVNLHRYAKDIEQFGRDKAVPQEIWSVEVETTGRPSDLGEVVPVMIAAAQPYIGVSTNDNVRVRLGETDSRIRAIKGN